MKKLLCVIVFSAAIPCFSQSYETKFIDPVFIGINCESFVILSNFEKVKSVSSPLRFHIKRGSLQLSVTGIIDKTSSRIMINLYAKETLDNEMLIIASSDSQEVQYKVQGAGTGSYGGMLNNDDSYIVNTGFRITAPGQPSYVLVLPINLRLSKVGNNNFTHCFIDGAAYLYNAEKKKKSNKELRKFHRLNKRSRQSIVVKETKYNSVLSFLPANYHPVP